MPQLLPTLRLRDRYSRLNSALIGNALAIAGVAFGVVAVGLKLLLTPIGAAIAAVVALGAAWLFMTDGGKKFRDAVGTTFGGIFDALQGGKFALAWQIALKGMQVAWLEFATSVGLNNVFHDLADGILILQRAWQDFMRDLHGSIRSVALFHEATGGFFAAAAGMPPLPWGEIAADQEGLQNERIDAGMALKAEIEKHANSQGDMGLARAKEELANLRDLARNRPGLVNIQKPDGVQGDSTGTFSAFAAARGSGVSGLMQRQIDLLAWIAHRVSALC